jgi:hypothetical protein
MLINGDISPPQCGWDLAALAMPAHADERLAPAGAAEILSPGAEERHPCHCR